MIYGIGINFSNLLSYQLLTEVEPNLSGNFQISFPLGLPQLVTWWRVSRITVVRSANQRRTILIPVG